MKDGKIAQAGKYNEILGSGKEFMELVGAHKDALAELDTIDAANVSNEGSPSRGTAKLTRALSSAEKKDKQDEGNNQSGQLVQEEEREKGKVGFWVYWKYLTLAYRGALVPLVLLG